MKRGIVVSFIMAGFICLGIAMTGSETVRAEAEKWVTAMEGFCTEGMVQDVKEEVSIGKSEFDQYCNKAGKSRAVDARCKNNNLEVKCQ